MFSKLRRRFKRDDEITAISVSTEDMLLSAMEAAGYAILSPDVVGILVTADDLGEYSMTAAGIDDAQDYVQLLRTLSSAMTAAADRMEAHLDGGCDCEDA